VRSDTDWELAADELLGFHRRMLEIRFFEDEVMRLFARNLVRGSTHLCQGQEAVSVGACSALARGDTMTCTYRGHGAVLAMGAPLDRAMAEILGKAEGLCGGKGGSMHLTDVERGALGSFAVVGAHLPFACGTALSAQTLRTGSVSLCFFGDGTTNIGAFHESMNLAAVWRLGVVFLCENNLYGEYSPIAATTSVARLADRAAAYAMPGVQVDGNDVLAVRAAVAEACTRARAGEGPTFVEALTYRHMGHSRSDPGSYRPHGELERWKERDPITLFESRLEADGAATRGQLDAAREDARAAVDAATAQALAWPDPEPPARFEHVWAETR
jgi:TPP-dependent pyruvate/acetoin dehydrogenase alpha subunit